MSNLPSYIDRGYISIEITKNLIQLKMTDETILQAIDLSIEKLNQLKDKIKFEN